MGITNFDTLAEYKKEDVQSLCHTLCKDTTAPMTIGLIVEKRLIIACALTNIYSLITSSLSQITLSRLFSAILEST